MRLKIIAIICLLHVASFLTLNAQWAKTYGGSEDDIAQAIIQTNEGGYIVVGQTKSFGSDSGDIWILKLDLLGDIEWERTYGAHFLEIALSIQNTNDGGFIVVGRFPGTANTEGGYDIWILKLSSNGDMEWEKRHRGSDSDYTYFIQQTNDGGYILTGYSQDRYIEGDATLYEYDIWVLKLYSNGDAEWCKTYKGSNYDYAYSIQQTNDGGYIVAGKTESFGDGSSDIWILKLNLWGDIEWQKAYGGSLSDEAYSIKQTSDGGYIVAGKTSSYGAGSSDVWILKLTLDGTIEWQKLYGGNNYDQASSIQRTNDGGYIVAGKTESFGAGSSDIWILKLNLGGDIEWQKAYGGSLSDEAYSIKQTSDGGYIVAGKTSSYGAGMEDLLVLKLLSNGDINSSCGLIHDSNAEVSDISVIPSDTNIIPIDTNIISSIPEISPNESEAVVYSLCSGQHILSITTSSGGTTVPQPGTYTYDHAERIDLNAKPDDGHNFIVWSGDIESTAKQLSMTMDSDKSIKANFSEKVIDEIIEEIKKAPCFIATAAFGSPHHPYVKTLQDFRDKYLMSNRPGRMFVRLYYKYSPHIAELITNHKVLKTAVRLWLVPFVAVGYSMVHFGPVKTTMMLVLSIMPLFFFVRFYRRRGKNNS